MSRPPEGIKTGDKSSNKGVTEKHLHGARPGNILRSGGVGIKRGNGMAPIAEEKIKRGIENKTRNCILNQYNGCTLFKVYLFITVP